MSFYNVSSLPSTRASEQLTAIANPRLQANAGEDSCSSTAAKVAVIFFGFLASATSFAIAGPLLGTAVTLLTILGTMYYFNAQNDPNDTTPRFYQTWFQPWYPTTTSRPMPATAVMYPASAPHVAVGTGQHTPPAVILAPATPVVSPSRSPFAAVSNFFGRRPTQQMNNQPGNQTPVFRAPTPHVPMGTGGTTPPPVIINNQPGNQVPVLRAPVPHVPMGTGGTTPPPARGGWLVEEQSYYGNPQPVVVEQPRGFFSTVSSLLPTRGSSTPPVTSAHVPIGRGHQPPPMMPTYPAPQPVNVQTPVVPTRGSNIPAILNPPPSGPGGHIIPGQGRLDRTS